MRSVENMGFIFALFSAALGTVIGTEFGKYKAGQEAMVRVEKLTEDNERLQAAIRKQQDSFKAFIKANPDRFPPPRHSDGQIVGPVSADEMEPKIDST